MIQSSHIKEKAKEIGFHLVGISTGATEKDKQFYNWWVDQGFGADMFYLRAQKERRQQLSEILPGAKSAIVCAMRFPGSVEDSTPPDLDTKSYGKIARYALHDDYHDTIKPKLNALADWIDTEYSGTKSLAYVDTGAIPERALAKEAGLGWIGKNAMLIHPEEGSYFWLGEVITTLELPPDLPISDHCGKCRRCLDACPTGAIFEDLRAIDSRKCLSYWNIEHRGAIPDQFHAPMQDWLLGCDICQEVCPWNQQSLRKARVKEGLPPVEWLASDEILALDAAEFKAKFAKRAVSRSKISGLQRNAAIVKKNWQTKHKA